MKSTRQSSIFLKSAIHISTALIFASIAAAQSVPPLINYQGRLTGQTGASLALGAYSIQFRLWDSPLASATNDLIWGQQQDVTVQSNGVFNVILGSPGGSPIANVAPAVNNLAYAFGGTNCFLGVTVVVSNGTPIASPTEILPRQQLLSVPFAVQAQQAQIASSLVSNLANALCPPGTIVAYMGTNAPPGWLLCDGSLVNRINFAALFSVIGTASGSGNGSTTFNLPDMRGVFLRGVNGTRSDSFADPDDDATLRTNIFIGGNTGNAVGSYQADQFQSHNHGVDGDDSGLQSGNYVVRGSGGVSHGITVRPTTSVGGNETRPKNAYVNYIIKY